MLRARTFLAYAASLVYKDTNTYRQLTSIGGRKNTFLYICIIHVLLPKAIAIYQNSRLLKKSQSCYGTHVKKSTNCLHVDV